MYKKICLIIFIFFLTGCYDHQELNDIAILSATEINKDKDNYIINAQIVNPQAPDKTITASAPFIIYKSLGKTIQESYRNIITSSPRYIYPDHLRIVIINENIAKKDITKLLDFYLRNPLARTEFKVLIGKDNDILNVITPIDTLSSSSILNTLKTSSNYLGTTSIVTLNDLADMYLNPRKEIVLPSIKLKNNNNEDNDLENIQKTESPNTYELDTLAVFKKGTLLGYLSKEESITYNIIKNNLKNTIINYECENNKYLSFEVIQNKSKITTKNKEIYIDINMTGTINESSCKLNLNNNKNINKLNIKLSNYVKSNITNNIENIKNKYNSDIFGFLDIIYKYDYNTYLELKDNWYNSEFKNIKININPKIKIIAKGNVMEGINEKN